MPVQLLDDGKRLCLTHPKGSTTVLLLYGATVISWKSSAISTGSGGPPQEHLFVSSKATLDGSKPVRGGIPIVFPNFGAPVRPEHKHLPQHGYARSSTWTWDSTVLDDETGVSVRLTLTPNASVTLGKIELAYIVTLTEHQLSCDLHVKNASPQGGAALAIQALLHTYLRAPAAHVRIKGLGGLHYIDKTVPETPRKQEARELVDVHHFTDFVYENAPREVTATWPTGSMNIRMIGFKDVVIWNPQAEGGSKLADLEEGGWERYVCVEPGYVAGFKEIQPGETWIGGQVLTPIQPLQFSL